MGKPRATGIPEDRVGPDSNFRHGYGYG